MGSSAPFPVFFGVILASLQSCRRILRDTPVKAASFPEGSLCGCRPWRRPLEEEEWGLGRGRARRVLPPSRALSQWESKAGQAHHRSVC